MKNIILLSHLGMGDMMTIMPAVRFLSSIAETVYIFCKTNYIHNVKQMYDDASNINVIDVGSEETKYPSVMREYISKFREDFVLYSCGVYNEKRNAFINIPDNFYLDLSLDLSLYNSHGKFPEKFMGRNESSKKIENFDYIFINGKTSSADITSEILKRISGDRKIICPSKNVYSETDDFYEIAESFLNLPLLDYIPTIRNAKEIYVADSAFSVLCKFVASDSCRKTVYNISGYSISTEFFKNWNVEKI